MTKKLALEIKIRDAAVSLSKVNSSHKKVSQQTTDQLKAANDRVDSAQKEHWKVSNRVNEVHKKLMEHRAGVLSFSVRSMEKKMSSYLAEDVGSNQSTLVGPASSSGATPSKFRFDGAHLFAGHADTIVPKRKLSADAAAAEITSLEKQLKAAKDSLTAVGKKQAEMARELSMIQLEKQEVETMMGMDLQAAEETIAALEKEIPRLEDLDSEVRQLREEKGRWERERAELMERGKEAEVLQARLTDMKTQTGEVAGSVEKMLTDIRENSDRQLEEKDSQIEMLKQQWEADRIAWQQERADFEDEKMEDIARLQDEMDRLREEDEQVLQQAGEELNAGLSTSRDLIKKHGIMLLSRDSSLQGLLNSIGMHIQTMHMKLEACARAESEWDVLRRRLEDEVRSGLDTREALFRELEDARRERDIARRDTLIEKVFVVFLSCLLVIYLMYLTRTSLHIHIHVQLQRQQLSYQMITMVTQTFIVFSPSCNLSGPSFHHPKPAQPNSETQANDPTVPTHPHLPTVQAL
jgi:chromosome segregation ATPase